MTVDKYSWSYRKNARALDVYSIQVLINQLVETVSFGGTLSGKLLIQFFLNKIPKL